MASKRTAARPERAEADAPRGRRRARLKGDRLNRTQLAERLKLDRKTVSKYLAMTGAPKPDGAMRFSTAQVRKWIDEVAPRIPSQTEEYKNLKLAMLRMDAEERALELGILRKELVKKKDIAPTITAFMAALTENLRNKFEFELPQKYEGKSTIEKAKMNADAIDWILAQLKSGAMAFAATG